MPLTVATVRAAGRRDLDANLLARAREYLEAHGIQAEFVNPSGAVAPTLMQVAAEHACDLILMGGYGSAPVVEVVAGSAVNTVLRESRLPVMICR
ncbi:MAG: universal stress protein [Anaerolineales bacterium]